jgi:hypothetical protein
VQTRLARFAACVLTGSIAAFLTGCTEPNSQSGVSPISPTSSPSPSRTGSPTPSAEELNLRRAERAVARFWRVIDRLSADTDSDLTELTTVSRGPVAAQWARNISQSRYDRVRSTGNVVVRDAMAKRSKKESMFRVTACIDVSAVKVTDNDDKSVVPADRPPRVSYDYVVEMDRQKWYVVEEKVIGTC